jgi:hypothetical protein
MSEEFLYKINDLVSFPIDPLDPEKAWGNLQDKIPHLSDWGVQTLRDALDGHVQSIVLEEFYTCKDHRNLFSNFYSKKFLAGSRDCSRLHFFNKPNVNVLRLLTNPEEFENGYLGFSVIRPIRERCLGRTVLDPYKIGKHINDHYYVLRTEFRAQIQGISFKVKGYPYTSQDTDATLCAHSALWGVCRYLSERYTIYRELHPYDFIRLTENSKGRPVPYRGMTYTDYCKILSDFGTFPIYRILNSTTQKIVNDTIQNVVEWDVDAFKDAYSYVESGFPVLASLRSVGHVVSLIGHTLDYNAVVGAEEFIDSSVFLKQFIVSDDNFPPYALLGYEGDPENYGKAYATHNSGKEVTIKNIHTVTCPLPEKVFLPAEEAREKAVKFYQKFRDEIAKTGAAPFVTRLFVTNSAAFKNRKLASLTEGKTGPDKAATLVTNLHLPHFIWVMEISPLDVYKKGRCTAEIVLDATAGLLDDGIIYMRIANKLLFAVKNSTIRRDVAGAPKEFPQYTHNLGEKII